MTRWRGRYTDDGKYRNDTGDGINRTGMKQRAAHNTRLRGFGKGHRLGRHYRGIDAPCRSHGLWHGQAGQQRNQGNQQTHREAR